MDTIDKPTESFKAVKKPPEIVRVDKASLSWKFFTAILDNQPLEASQEELMHYASYELRANLDTMHPTLIENLPTIIVAQMNVWSGWHFKADYLERKFVKEHYFVRFHKHMVHKIAHPSLIKNFACALRDADSKFDGNSKSELDFSNYAISIETPPNLLNTIVFSNIGDDVIMKQHLGTNWQQLSSTQLMNWPHIEVTFESDDLRFIRRQANEYIRYLNFLPHEVNKVKDVVVENVEILRPTPNSLPKRVCYTTHFLDLYIGDYIKAISKIRIMNKASLANKLEEIRTILYQFLEDVKLINVNNSIATNTRILFQLCNVPFIRNKKLVKGNGQGADEARVGYCEIITPKVELTCVYIKAIQNATPFVSFKLPTEIEKKCCEDGGSEDILPKISYKCTFCKVVYGSVNSKFMMLEHLKREHKMEQHVRCTVCKKQFDVLNLTACRWKHKCLAGNGGPITIN